MARISVALRSPACAGAVVGGSVVGMGVGEGSAVGTVVGATLAADGVSAKVAAGGAVVGALVDVGDAPEPQPTRFRQSMTPTKNRRPCCIDLATIRDAPLESAGGRTHRARHRATGRRAR